MWKSIIIFLAGIFCCGIAAPGMAATSEAEASLKKNFPQLHYESLQPSIIKGVYEVDTVRGTVYYVPDAACLIVGNIFTNDGKNITRRHHEEKVLERAKTLPLARALRIGSGRHTIIEITDPDCPYCRKAAKALSEKKDTTRYIFFYPLSPTSENKVRHILCAPDPGAAYRESYQGVLDQKALVLCKSAEVDELIKIHKDQGRRLGVEGTPYFIIDSHIVSGADIPMIEKLLSTP
ncbi:MAG TPA: DsbC family protein [Syntrophales bacterium]|jgi:thiol:disulfide interchange protein DsbC|nr:DsbC family protein [Syntrophales bacterium]HOU52235.1 DsbC family protein [Smithella sp.]HPC33934.1 DsbC family protein [Syntrophales bacterium]HQG35468.1 DsbC family protein [Syntrophales bacterium]HQI36885.1 DsbC family protein [Syntrophales bacterium]